MKVTAILEGRGGELDRVTFQPKRPYYGLREIREAVLDRDGSSWSLNNGDVIRIVEMTNE